MAEERGRIRGTYSTVRYTGCIYVFKSPGDLTRSRPLSVPFSSDKLTLQSELTLGKGTLAAVWRVH